MKPPLRSTRGRKGVTPSPSTSPSASPSALPSPLPTTEAERAPIRPPLLSSYVPFVPPPPFEPNIIRLPSQNDPPTNISLAGLRMELLTGRTIILYDDDVPPSDADEEDEHPPPLQSREDSSDEEEEEEDKYAHRRAPRKSYSISRKKSYVKQISKYRTQNPKVSIRNACAKFVLNESLYTGHGQNDMDKFRRKY